MKVTGRALRSAGGKERLLTKKKWTEARIAMPAERRVLRVLVNAGRIARSQLIKDTHMRAWRLDAILIQLSEQGLVEAEIIWKPQKSITWYTWKGAVL